ncbi:MAG TPA: PilN domain-containing protein [Thermodesulfobacteriota bacterium]|nr:PilN domain-containing protein [Thermodesulfobacteriota bacterium]
MEKITINLSTGRYARGQSVRLMAAALTLVALVFSYHTVYDYYVNAKTISLLKGEIARLGEAKAGKAAPRKDFSKIPAASLEKKVFAINDIIIRETFSWTELLTGMEEVTPGNVSIVRITPDFKDNKIAVSGMAASVKDALSFVTNLSSSPKFGDAFLLKHSEEKGDELSRERVFFNVSANYGRQGKE